MTSGGSGSSETFSDAAQIRLFGKPFSDLTYSPDNNKTFARIYGFSFEGHYYKLPRPALFLFDSGGQQCGPGGNSSDDQGPFETAVIGVESRDWHFGRDIMVWTVNKYDRATRLDVEIGTYDEVLLQPMTGAEAAFRNAASFRTKAVGVHQDR